MDLCRSFAEWKAAQQDAPGFRRLGGGGTRGGGGGDTALLAALEHAGFGLRLSARRGQALYALPLDIALPQGCVSSLSSSVLCRFVTPPVLPFMSAVNAW